MGLIIRQATPLDSQEILGIYASYVKNTTVSFETAVPFIQHFQERVSGILAQYPFPVCILGNQIIGYAYATKYRERAAYRYDVETSVYIRENEHSHGIGTALYRSIFDILVAQGYYNAYAIIVLPNDKSLCFHEKLGFQPIGIHHKTGYKFDDWHDAVWMEKALQKHDSPPDVIRAISELPIETVADIYARNASRIGKNR